MPKQPLLVLVKLINGSRTYKTLTMAEVEQLNHYKCNDVIVLYYN